MNNSSPQVLKSASICKHFFLNIEENKARYICDTIWLHSRLPQSGNIAQEWALASSFFSRDVKKYFSARMSISSSLYPQAFFATS